MLRTANDLQKPIVVTLVVSTESTDSLETVLGHLSPHTRGVYVVLQKPSADGGAPLSAKKLKKASKLPVLELDQKTKYKSGHVYLARMHTILSIDDENQSFLLREAQDKTEVLAVADLTFKAIAKPLGARLVGVVLSGGGTDGTQGLTQVHDHGGMAVAISPKAAQFPSMAESAISTGIVDHVLAP